MHFFWIFGHPEVYVLDSAFVRIYQRDRPGIFAQSDLRLSAMVAASVGIGFISTSVWAHHMFYGGHGRGSEYFLCFATMVISVPTGIKIFNWLATIWGGKVIFELHR
jgi:cytochrome c oxidase subunit I